MITIGELPARLRVSEEEATAAVMAPGEVVSQLIGGRFHDDPGSLRSTWPGKPNGWVHMEGEAVIEGEIYPTSVTVYYPHAIERLMRTIFGKEPQARIKLGVGNPQPAPDQAYNLVQPPLH